MYNKKIKLIGNRIYLRQLKLSDCNSEYVSWLNNKKNNKYLEARHTKNTIQKIKLALSKTIKSNNAYIFAICLKKNLHIGNIKLDEINYDHKYAYLGYLIGNQKYINKGYAAEAVALILNFSFNKLKLRNILSSTYKNNIASQKVLKKIDLNYVENFKTCYLMLIIYQ